MSRESLQDLNAHTLIGNTDHRGTAWHYRADLQDEEPNHYSGPIPVEDVSRRLFHWQAVPRRVGVEVPATIDSMTHLSEDGSPLRWSVLADKKAVCREDTHEVLGIFAPSYALHQYDQWLLSTVADLLDDDLSVSSAGLLRNGAIAWVEVSVPDSLATPEGVVFRPNLLCTTSFDGSIATTYKRTVTDVVCDNTRESALAEKGQTYKVKHSRYSAAKLGPAREALAMVHTAAEEFAAEIAQLCATTVTEKQWQMFLDLSVPRQSPSGAPLSARAASIADRKRETLQRLYQHDSRVAPWAGTAHGVIQAVNTYEHHEGAVRGTTRAERNMLRAVTGEWRRVDRTAYEDLRRVLV